MNVASVAVSRSDLNDDDDNKYTRDGIKMKSQDIVKMAINIICICQKQLEFHTTRRLGVISIHSLIQSFSLHGTLLLLACLLLFVFLILISCAVHNSGTVCDGFCSQPQLSWAFKHDTIPAACNSTTERHNSMVRK